MAILDKKTQNLISYYDVLNVSPESSDEDIKIAYRRMAKRYHPDQNPQNRRMSELRFKLINEAFLHIETREKRARYNRMLRLQAQNDNDGETQTLASKIERETTPSLFSQLVSIFFPQRLSGHTSSHTSSRKG